MMEVEEISKKCCARLREKIRLLHSYKLATDKIKDALESRDVTLLGGHLKERQGIMVKVNRIDKEIEKCLQANGFSVEKLSEKAKDLVGGYLDQIKAALESISGPDKKCLELARSGHDNIKSEILQLQRVRRVARGYRPTPCHPPRFLDMKR